ncbi:MAG: SGNH/GDSL hydrolase family protein, partial [Lachnospiraceae bacterium]|nr:SGNH/GDSL hydrolase family protein [Lachnospiraceae bacterium]
MKQKFIKSLLGICVGVIMISGFCACGKEEGTQMKEGNITPKESPSPTMGEISKEDSVPTGESPSFEEFILPEEILASADAVCENASEMTRRSLRSLGNTRRLQQVFARMQAGEEVTVAYLGGSITEGYLVNSVQNYAYKTTAWLKQIFGNDKIKHVNAGLSGTSSTIGLLRVKQDVLDYSPDLVFLEFAVNDSNDVTSKMMYESLVSRIVNSETAPALVLIFTVLENGYTCEEHMSAIGEAYQLPMVSVQAALSEEISAGALSWSDYAQDEAHPTNQGHTYIAEFIQYLFAKTMGKRTLPDKMDYTVCKKYGDAYSGMVFYNTKNLYLKEMGGFVESNSNITHFQNNWLWGKEGGDGMKFTLTGRNLVVLYREANNDRLGTAVVSVDGKLAAKIASNSPSGWNNPQTAVVLNEVTEGEHEIEIRMEEGEEGKDFHILAFGTTGEIHGEERIAEEDIPYQERAVVNIGNTYNIQKVMERAQAGEELTIGFIGGSITQGTGASNGDLCYAKLVHDWWCETFPQAKFNYVNAGIGATTSQFACARVADDLLSYNPDFVVVEFSVNDEASDFYGETYESLLRLILQKGGEDTAVMVLNMVQYDSGINAQGVHNPVAKAYGIPAVSMKDAIYKEINFGRLTPADVSSDMIHPNDRGHAYGAELITYFLGKVKDGTYKSDKGAVLPEPKVALKSMTSVRYDSRNAAPVLDGFVKDEAAQNGIRDIFKNGYTAKNEGDSIIFENIYGSRISLQYKKTNALGAPLAVAVVDGKEEQSVLRDGIYPDGLGDWLYLHNIADGLSADVQQNVEIRNTQGA